MLAVLPILLSIRPWVGREAVFRPSLSGPEETVDAGRFLIRFTRTGRDAPTPSDADANGLPDLIDVLRTQLPIAEQAYLDEGWTPLVGDVGVGGTDQIDVYVVEIDAFGYSTSVPASDGSSSCFLEIDPALTLPGQVAASVATHELHHCVEFRYATGLSSWVYEAAATYEQYTHVLDPLLDVAVGVLYGRRLAEPERRLADADGQFEYAAFLWMKYWAEAGGADDERLVAEPHPERLIELWQALGAHDTWREGMDAASEAAFGRGLSATYLDHAVWNGFACANADGAHYLDSSLPCIATVAVPETAWDGAPITVTHTDQPFTAAYLSLPTDGPRTGVRCDGDDDLRYAAVAVDGTGAELAAATGLSGDPLSVPTVPGGAVRVVLTSSDAPIDASCEAFTPPAPDRVGCATGPSAGPSAGRAGLGSSWVGALGAFALRRRRSARTP